MLPLMLTTLPANDDEDDDDRVVNTQELLEQVKPPGRFVSCRDDGDWLCAKED